MKKTGGLLFGALLFALSAWSHITIRSQGPLYPRQRSTLVLHVPNERNVEINKIVLEVSDAFLRAGGRVEQVQALPGWEAVVEKQDKPADIFALDQKRAEEREARLQQSSPPNSPEAKAQRESDRQARRERLKQWIKTITFQGGKIPPDGFAQFPLEITLPRERGRFYFPVAEVHSDGQTVAWSDPRLGEDVERPAATILIQSRYGLPHFALAGALFLLAALLLRPIQRYRKWRGSRASPATARRAG